MDIPSDTDLDRDIGNCDKCKYFDKPVQLPVEKCKALSRKAKIQMLTLVPDS